MNFLEMVSSCQLFVLGLPPLRRPQCISDVAQRLTECKTLTEYGEFRTDYREFSVTSVHSKFVAIAVQESRGNYAI